jgi:hypothetical protein
MPEVKKYTYKTEVRSDDESSLYLKITLSPELKEILESYCVKTSTKKEGENIPFERYLVKAFITGQSSGWSRIIFSKKLMDEGSEEFSAKRLNDITACLEELKRDLPRMLDTHFNVASERTVTIEVVE